MESPYFQFHFIIDGSGRTLPQRSKPQLSFCLFILLHIPHTHTHSNQNKTKKTLIPIHHTRPIKSIKSRTFNYLCSSIIRTNSAKHTNPSPFSSTSLIIRRQSSNVHRSSPIDLKTP